MILHHYQSNSGKDLILNFIKSLPEDEKLDGFSVLQCLENNEMDKINFKRWEKKVYEVYFYKYNRLFYIVADRENIYVLHACKNKRIKQKRIHKANWLQLQEADNRLFRV